MFKFELGEIVQSFDGKVTGLMVIGQTQWVDGCKSYWLAKSGFDHNGGSSIRHQMAEYEIRATPKKEA